MGFLVQRLGGWFSIRSSLESSRAVVDYWVPHDRAYMLYLIDSGIIPLADQSYVDHR